jgi:hypothetical protein
MYIILCLHASLQRYSVLRVYTSETETSGRYRLIINIGGKCEVFVKTITLFSQFTNSGFLPHTPNTTLSGRLTRAHMHSYIT